MSGRPRLAVGITARDCADRLPALIAHARTFADEVVVGVDDASVDLTLEVAAALADVVYRFEEPLGFRVPRTLAVTRTTCDWLLMLDDDESTDPALPEALPVLLSTDCTHWALPRRLASLPDPLSAGVATADGFDWQVRLVRADPSLLWETPLRPGGLRVMGSAGREAGVALLRHGAVMHPPTAGPTDVLEDHARILPGVVNVARLPRVPAWHATFGLRALTTEAEPGAIVFAEIDARNTGGLLWSVPSERSGDWPRLALVCRYTDPAGAPVDGTEQVFPLPTDAAPGATVRFGCSVDLPPQPGRHMLHWDMRSEGDVWFADCGAEPLTTLVRTRNGPRIDRG